MKGYNKRETLKQLTDTNYLIMKINNSDRLSIFWVNAFILFLSLTIPVLAKAQAEIIKNDSVPKNKISEEKFILINGIEQWVTIKREISKPIILFIHGGPGSPLSPYSDKSLQRLGERLYNSSIGPARNRKNFWTICSRRTNTRIFKSKSINS